MSEDQQTLREHASREAIRRATLYGILDLGYVSEAGAEEMASRLIAAGVQILQLRAKKLMTTQVASLAEKIAPICRQAGIPFLLNDHPNLVEACGADGVHVGQDDLSIADARAMAGPHAIVGKSTHSLAQAISAEREGADYIGFGPLFATPTKPDYPAVGLDHLREVQSAVSVPVFCIGGIKLSNLPVVLTAGAQRVVIVSGLLQADNVTAMVKECLNLLGKRDLDLS